MLLQLQLSGYADRIWNPIAEEFARYGVSVMKSWIGKRTIFGQVKARTGFQLRSCPDDWLQSVHVAEDLAGLTVVLALQYFKEQVLKANKWDPARGASLRTFFIGQCLYQFPNVYKTWLHNEQELHALQQVVADDDLHYLAGGIGNIEEPVITHDSAVTALGTLTTAKAQRAFAMKALGYSHAEIADNSTSRARRASRTCSATKSDSSSRTRPDRLVCHDKSGEPHEPPDTRRPETDRSLLPRNSRCSRCPPQRLV